MIFQITTQGRGNGYEAEVRVTVDLGLRRLSCQQVIPDRALRYSSYRRGLLETVVGSLFGQLLDDIGETCPEITFEGIMGVTSGENE